MKLGYLMICRADCHACESASAGCIKVHFYDLFLDRIVNLYTKLHKTMGSLKYFTSHEWKWTYNNMAMLSSKMSPEDQKVMICWCLYLSMSTNCSHSRLSVIPQSNFCWSENNWWIYVIWSSEIVWYNLVSEVWNLFTQPGRRTCAYLNCALHMELKNLVIL